VKIDHRRRAEKLPQIAQLRREVAALRDEIAEIKRMLSGFQTDVLNGLAREINRRPSSIPPPKKS